MGVADIYIALVMVIFVSVIGVALILTKDDWYAEPIDEE